MFRLTHLGPWAVVALAISALTTGCSCDDDGGSETAVSIAFVSPFGSDPATLTCDDDSDRETRDVIEYDVAVTVVLGAASADGLQVALSVGDGDVVTVDVGEAGQTAIFEDFPLPVGDGLELAAALLRDGTETDRITATYDASWVEADCVDADAGVDPPDEDVELTFTAPSDGDTFMASDDADGDLSNGFQTDIRLQVANATSGTVELTVAGADAGSVAVVGDAPIEFDDVTLPFDSDVSLVALYKPEGDGEDVEARISVSVDITACALEVRPAPSGGQCDVTTADDLDPAEGIQIRLEATSTCGEVVFTINGEDQAPVQVDNGGASAIVTLQPGQNTIAARGSTDSGLSAEVAEYNLFADDSLARIDVVGLEAQGENLIALPAGAAADAQRFDTRIVATATDIDGDVTVTFDPPVDGFQNGPVAVEPGGTVNIDVAVETYACTTLTLSGTDRCGTEARSPSYDICFDPVRPLVDIMGPESGRIVVDPAAAETQLDIDVRVTDPRPASVDYLIVVECRTPTTLFSDRFVRVADRTLMRSDLDDDAMGTVTITFEDTDVGEHTCRGSAVVDEDRNPNGPLHDEDNYRVFDIDSTIPEFSVVLPQPNTCYGPDNPVVVGGTASGFNGGVAELSVVVTPEGGDARTEMLSDQGGGNWTVTFGEDDVEALDDGDYSAAFVGTVDDEVVEFMLPAEALGFVVDLTMPTLELVAPADTDLGADDDLNADPDDCIQTALTFGVADANTEEVCYSVNGSAERCVVLDGETGQASVEVSLLSGGNSVDVRARDCGGNEATATYNLNADCATPRLQITSPRDGAQLARGDDLEAESMDTFELDVTVDTRDQDGMSTLNEGDEIRVRTTVGDGTVETDPVAVAADGTATVRLSVAIPEAAGESFEFTLQAVQADGSAPGPRSRVTVFLVPPSIEFTGLPECAGLAVPDASLDAGFQIALSALVGRVQDGREATVTADCGAGESEAVGTVAGGRIDFGALTITIPDGAPGGEANCALAATVTDAAGQEATIDGMLRVDREAPRVTIDNPPGGRDISSSDDLDDNTPGIQFQPRIIYCGAPGEAFELDIQPDPDGDGEPFVGMTDDEECTEYIPGRVTLVEGDMTIEATTTDACGNVGSARWQGLVRGGGTINISEPARPGSPSLVNLEDELEANRAVPGCQVDLRAAALGIGENATFYVCTNVEQGDQPAACDGAWSALAGECDFNGAVRGEVTCPLDLSEGVHSLRVVVENGGRLTSDDIEVTADCSAPVIEAIAVVNDADANGCLNRQERTNATAGTDQSRFTVRVQTSGVVEGTSLSLRGGIGGPVLASVAADAAGVGTFALQANPRSYEFYVSTRDAAGNPAAGPDEDGFLLVPFRLDPVVPAPSVVNLAAQQCLNADDDEGAGDGLQYGLQLIAGGEVDEQGSVARLSLDGAAPVERMVVGDRVDFDALDIADGSHEIELTVADSCGNVGSVGGFVMADMLPDWNQPVPVEFRVDTVAPDGVVGGLMADAVYTEADDADGNPTNGFQRDVTVDFDPRDGLETGRTFTIRSGDLVFSSDPSPLTIPEPFDAPIAARLTMTPGQHEVVVRATDACGNVGTSAPVSVTVDISGCASSIGALGGEILGRADGNPTQNGLEIDVPVSVDVTNADCQMGTATLLLDCDAPGGCTELANQPVSDGDLTFAGVEIPAGDHALRVRVDGAGEVLDSLDREVTIDFNAPTITVTTPAEGVNSLTQDQDGNPGNGLQTTVVARVDEVMVRSARTATLSVGGMIVAGPTAVPAGNPASVSFDLTFQSGDVTFEVCVTDAVNNTVAESCQQRTVTVDPAAPGAIDLAVEINDRRAPQVTLNFAAPAEDGDSGGRVANFEVRTSNSQMAGEAAWGAATVLLENVAPTVDPGMMESIVLDGLNANTRPWVAVRALDDAGRLSPIAQVQVDLRYSSQSWTIPERTGAWNPAYAFDTVTLNLGPMLTAGGDLDNDGADDLLIAGFQQPPPGSPDPFPWQASVVFGVQDENDLVNAERVDLALPDVGGGAWTFLAYGVQATGIGDVNADAVPDVGVIGFWLDDAFNPVTVVGIYFGSGGGNRPAVAAPDAVVTITGGFYGTLGSAGNFIQPAGDMVPFDDIVVGHDFIGANPGAVVVAGRSSADWTGFALGDAGTGVNIDATANADRANGIISVLVPGAIANPGGAFGNTGNGPDGLSNLIYSVNVAAGIFDAYWFRGVAGNDIPADTYTYVQADANTVRIPYPCGGTRNYWGSSIAGGVDLDGDENGYGDFVLADRDRSTHAVFTNDGQFIDCFRGSTLINGSFLSIAGDPNGDGATDVVYMPFDSPVGVLYNDGDAVFGLSGVVNGLDRSDLIFRPDAEVRHLGVVGVGDMNRDGRDDIGILTYDDADMTLTVFY